MAGILSNKKIGIIGGGITGVITAIFLARAGNKVTIFDKNKLLSETSSSTTKLLHGGIRYLENLQIKEVRNGLNDRHWWLKNFPNNTSAIEIFIPFKNIFSIRFIKYFIGIKLYEFLSFKKKLGSGKIIFGSRNVVKNQEMNFLNFLSFIDGYMDDELLSEKLRDELSQLDVEIYENYEVNDFNLSGAVNNFNFDNVILASGPWNKILLDKNNLKTDKDIDLIKGSHLVLDRKINRAYMFEAICKKRYIFALPYKNNTLLGTTEKRTDSPDTPIIDEDEKDYLIQSYNSFFSEQITPENILYNYSGVRPLIKSNKKNFHNSSRDFYIDQNEKLICVFGGKWTTAPSIAKKIVTIINNG